MESHLGVRIQGSRVGGQGDREGEMREGTEEDPVLSTIDACHVRHTGRLWWMTILADISSSCSDCCSCC